MFFCITRLPLLTANFDISVSTTATPTMYVSFSIRFLMLALMFALVRGTGTDTALPLCF